MARKENKLLTYLLARGVLGTPKESQVRKEYYNMLKRESLRRKQTTSKAYTVWFEFTDVTELERRAKKSQVSVTKLIYQSALQNTIVSLPSQALLNQILAKVHFIYSVEHLENMEVSIITKERMRRLEKLYTEILKLLTPCL